MDEENAIVQVPGGAVMASTVSTEEQQPSRLRRKRAVIACSLTLAAAPTPAWAYLDPGTGSLILQMLVAGALGALVYMRVAWDRTREFFGRVFGALSGSRGMARNPDDESEPASAMDELPDERAKTG